MLLIVYEWYAGGMRIKGIIGINKVSSFIGNDLDLLYNLPRTRNEENLSVSLDVVKL